MCVCVVSELENEAASYIRVFARQTPVCLRDEQTEFIALLFDGMELNPRFQTRNASVVCSAIQALPRSPNPTSSITVKVLFGLVRPALFLGQLHQLRNQLLSREDFELGEAKRNGTYVNKRGRVEWGRDASFSDLHALAQNMMFADIRKYDNNNPNALNAFAFDTLLEVNDALVYGDEFPRGNRSWVVNSARQMLHIVVFVARAKQKESNDTDETTVVVLDPFLNRVVQQYNYGPLFPPGQSEEMATRRVFELLDAPFQQLLLLLLSTANKTK